MVATTMTPPTAAHVISATGTPEEGARATAVG